MIDTNTRRAALPKKGRFGFSCQLCKHMDYETELDSLDRTHCNDFELLLWDSRHMVENDVASAKPRFRMVRSRS
jgi:hypothetical protein